MAQKKIVHKTVFKIRMKFLLFRSSWLQCLPCSLRSSSCSTFSRFAWCDFSSSTYLQFTIKGIEIITIYSPDSWALWAPLWLCWWYRPVHRRSVRKKGRRSFAGAYFPVHRSWSVFEAQERRSFLLWSWGTARLIHWRYRTRQNN